MSLLVYRLIDNMFVSLSSMILIFEAQSFSLILKNAVVVDTVINIVYFIKLFKETISLPTDMSGGTKYTCGGRRLNVQGDYMKSKTRHSGEDQLCHQQTTLSVTPSAVDSNFVSCTISNV